MIASSLGMSKKGWDRKRESRPLNRGLSSTASNNSAEANSLAVCAKDAKLMVVIFGGNGGVGGGGGTMFRNSRSTECKLYTKSIVLRPGPVVNGSTKWLNAFVIAPPAFTR